ncbi:unnamed protein product [Blepharisma stoltei]|uniref:Uncharacterized protein n=1 Tax=Blepharisma stoltei TaxID=1481888 RepID=A0AAU9JTF1_9CILI|nr:unnamed protein product [Blepharisma stoltei]
MAFKNCGIWKIRAKRSLKKLKAAPKFVHKCGFFFYLGKDPRRKYENEKKIYRNCPRMALSCTILGQFLYKTI